MKFENFKYKAIREDTIYIQPFSARVGEQVNAFINSEGRAIGKRYDTNEYREFKQQIRAAVNLSKEEVEDKNLKLTAIFGIDSANKKGYFNNLLVTKKPDCDNLSKAFIDGMFAPIPIEDEYGEIEYKPLGVDDSRVVQLDVAKIYTEGEPYIQYRLDNIIGAKIGELRQLEDENSGK